MEEYASSVHAQCAATATALDHVIKLLIELKVSVTEVDKTTKWQVDEATKAIATSINAKKDIKKQLVKNSFNLEAFQRAYGNLQSLPEIVLPGFAMSCSVELASAS